MVLESYLRRKLEERDLLIMTHIVLGYPSFRDCFGIVRSMVKAGVDLVELQIPFSDPIADGPIILQANQKAECVNENETPRSRNYATTPSVEDGLVNPNRLG